MNLLAHALLSGDSPGRVVGGVVADVIRGPVPEELPADVAEGVRLHRRIDIFTDAHPVTARSRGRLRSKWGRYSGILVDLVYDYCLVRLWPRFAPGGLPEFVRGVYGALADRAPVLPDLTVRYSRVMAREDWLTSYGRWDGQRVALERISTRLRRRVELAAAVADLQALEAELLGDFEEFFPDVAAHAACYTVAPSEG